MARERRNHQMKGVATVPAVAEGIGQGADRIEKLHDGSWPAVDQHQRDRVWRAGPHVQKMHGRAVDHSGVLREAVDARLVPPPVIARTPVLRELYEIAERHPSF